MEPGGFKLWVNTGFANLYSPALVSRARVAATTLGARYSRPTSRRRRARDSSTCAHALARGWRPCSHLFPQDLRLKRQLTWSRQW
jgi:hypothetical protein